MRKHHARWVALFGATALATTGTVGPVTVAQADEQSLAWPVVTKGEETYSLDGYTIGHLPEGLEQYGVNASSSTDRQNNRQSRISWIQGADELYARVTVVRSERVQDLEDLRESTYSHLASSELEQLTKGEDFNRDAYLSEATGDLFWLEEPGVAITTHLRPERWNGEELVRLAESVAETEEEVPEEDPAEDEAPEGEAPEDEGPGEENQKEEAGGPAEENETPDEEAQEEEPEVTEDDPATVPGAPAEETEEAQEADGQPEDTDEGRPTEEQDELPVEESVPGDGNGITDPVLPAEPVEPAEAELPEGVEPRDVKDCLVERLVDLDSGETTLDEDALPEGTEAFLDQALTVDELSEDERDRLLAVVWQHGDERDKTSAARDCAAEFRLEQNEVEGVVGETSGHIDETAQENQEGQETTSEDPKERTHVSADGDAPETELDPVDAEEWEEMWESLPWSLPEEQS